MESPLNERIARRRQRARTRQRIGLLDPGARIGSALESHLGLEGGTITWVAHWKMVHR